MNIKDPRKMQIYETRIRLTNVNFWGKLRKRKDILLISSKVSPSRAFCIWPTTITSWIQKKVADHPYSWKAWLHKDVKKSPKLVGQCGHNVADLEWICYHYIDWVVSHNHNFHSFDSRIIWTGQFFLYSYKRQ